MGKWLESSKKESFMEYCERIVKNDVSVVIVDDMVLQTEMYLQFDCIYVQTKEFVKELIQLLSISETEFLKKYMAAFEDFYSVEGTMVVEDDFVKFSNMHKA